nr:peroxiredoxin-2B [Tanacetum cinerariifolium]GEW82210.1 putative thioredoxin-like fold protein [Tanacetum cinerariifolium]
MHHIPSFIEKSEELKSKGIEQLLWINVNALGLELDLSKKGLGVRSRRYAMLVDNLKVDTTNIEEGGEFTVPGAADILKDCMLYAKTT